MIDFMQELVTELCSIHLLDMIHSYDDRNRCVVKAVWLALMGGMEAGFRIDPEEPDWPVAFIELPTGQISFHIPSHPKIWDNHDTEEKYMRINRFIEEYSKEYE